MDTDDDISIKIADLTDLEDIVNTHYLCLQVTHQDDEVLRSIFAKVTIEGQTIRWTSRLTSDNVFTFIARSSSGTLLGLSALETDINNPTVYEFLLMYIHPDYWRRGIGTALSEARFMWVKNRGGTDVIYKVYSKDVRSIAFHRKLGCHETRNILVNYLGVSVEVKEMHLNIGEWEKSRVIATPTSGKVEKAT